MSSASAAASVGDASSSAAADVDGANATSSSSSTGSAGHASIAVGAQAPRLHICLVYPDREGRLVTHGLAVRHHATLRYCGSSSPELHQLPPRGSLIALGRVPPVPDLHRLSAGMC